MEGFDTVTFEVLERRILPSIHSASGITCINNNIYIIGDNVSCLYELDEQLNLLSKIPVNDLGFPVGQLIAKADKPDFEALEAIEWAGEDKEIVFLGSGSKSPQRDVLVRVDPINRKVLKTYSLQNLYDKIRASVSLKYAPLNIEAVARDSENLFLLNRGNNVIFQYPFSAFRAYLDEEKEYPEPLVFKVKLPKIKGMVPGLTGATVIPGKAKLIFTAAIEDTPNPIDDGEVLGSFIGLIDINDFNAPPVCLPILEEGKPLSIKVESIAIIGSNSTHQMEILLVTDSDGGNSEILRCQLNLA